MNLEAVKQQAREALELAEKATPGPWTVEPDLRPNIFAPSGGYAESGHVATVVETETSRGKLVAWQSKQYKEDDADFIAASRTLVPVLAGYVLELAVKVEVLQDQTRTGRYLEANAEERLKAVIIAPVIEENKRLASELEQERHLHQQANEELADMVNLWTQAKDELDRLKGKQE